MIDWPHLLEIEQEFLTEIAGVIDTHAEFGVVPKSQENELWALRDRLSRAIAVTQSVRTRHLGAYVPRHDEHAELAGQLEGLRRSLQPDSLVRVVDSGNRALEHARKVFEALSGDSMTGIDF